MIVKGENWIRAKGKNRIVQGLAKRNPEVSVDEQNTERIKINSIGCKFSTDVLANT